MTPTRWQKAEEIFHAALDLPAVERDRYVTAECHPDTDLANIVRGMIEADAETSPFGLDSVVERAASIAARDEKGEAPQRLGPYRIEREIGTGGMGTVYLATRADDQYQKQVAVKLIHRGMTFPGSVERFLQERQILANLDHPYIARLLDGGAAPDGRPYLILDYVEGSTIVAYCAAEHLTIAARCSLFLKVCEAVAYAHQQLVVHRDLKPANILVNTNGMPKLLDFGIAKLLSDTAPEAVTRSALAMLTPEYASPEQVHGQPVSTSMDVYALGAILFELLAGRSPHRFESFSATELVRVICQQEAPPVSQVASERIPADLDRIVRKALAKDPRDRYTSVEQLGDDIRRHLQGRPVLARGNSRGYRARKFLVRHWVPVAAVVLIMTSLVGGMVIARQQAAEAQRLRVLAETERSKAEQAMREATAQRGAAQRNATEANAQRERANQRFHQVRTLIQRFLFDIDSAVQDVPGTSQARRVVAQTALEYLDGMTQEDMTDRGIQRELAQAYERVADLQGNPARPSLNDFPSALLTYQKALRIRQQLGLDSTGARAEMMALHASIGTIYRTLAKREESAKVLTAGLKLSNGAAANDRGMLLAAANLYHQRAQVSARSSEAIADYREAERILTRITTQWPAESEVIRSLAMTRMQLGLQLCRAGNYPEGLPHLRASVAEMQRIVDADANNMGHQRSLGLALRELANALLDRTAGAHRDTAEALRLSEQQVTVSKLVAEKDAGNHTARRDYIRAVAALARAHSARDEWEPAARIFSGALEMTEAYMAAHASDSGMQQDVGYYLAEIATAEFHRKNYTRSLAAGQRAVKIWEDLLAKGSNRFLRFNIALMVRRFGDIADVQGDRPSALREYRRALDVFRELQQADPDTQMFRYQVKMTEEILAKLGAAQ